MEIAIDYASAVWQGAGIGRYTRALTRELLRLDHENRYTLLFPAGLPGRPAPFLGHLEKLREIRPDVRLRPLPLTDRYLAIFWQRLRVPLPVEALCGWVDLFFSPDFVLPPQRRGRRMVTIHDLAFLVYPECAVPRMTWYLHGAVSRAAARADLVLAGSQSCREDILRFLRLPPERVVVLYSGVESYYQPLDDVARLAEVRARYALPERFLLTVGTIEPRKNLPRLFQALASLPERVRLPLLVAGKPGWLYEETFAAVERLGLHHWVRFLGFVPDEDMVGLYNLALGVVYPSLYEGFGVPPLEGLACGTPVLTSNVSAMPEVVGDAAILVDPKDPASIADGLRRLIEDEELRRALRAAGPERARLFTWERAGRQLFDIVRRLLHRDRSSASPEG
ncbi:MAG: glycosyltransferase family 4 protein [Chloroflexia bacterium]